MSLRGIDVSHYQAGLNLSGADFAIFKATQGTSMVDHECDHFVTQARSKGILWGVYHFAEGQDVDGEVNHFVTNVAGYIGQGILVLDWEADAVHQGPGWAKAWLDKVTDRTGVRPLIYMSESVCTEYDWRAVAADYALWVARYSSSIGSTAPWSSAAMWQYTDRESFNGQSVDGDEFYGTAETWARFAGSIAPTPEPEPEPEEDEMPAVLVKAKGDKGGAWWIVNAAGRRWCNSETESSTLIFIGQLSAQRNNQPFEWDREQIEAIDPMPGYPIPKGW